MAIRVTPHRSTNRWLISTINQLQQLPQRSDTAVFIAWDDSDGWYDHVIGPIMNQSATPKDALAGAGTCGSGADSLAGIQGRCGYGPRLPLVAVSAYARQNFVDSGVLDQTSIIRFIEDNWGLGRIGDGSFDAIAGDASAMFDFKHVRQVRIFWILRRERLRQLLTDRSAGENLYHP